MLDGLIVIIPKEMSMSEVPFCFMIKATFIQISLFTVIAVSLPVALINHFVSMYACLLDTKLRVFFGLAI